MSRVYFYVVPGSDGWQVQSRGFAWDCGSKQVAMEFAESIAKDYTTATGNPTCVRVQPNAADEFPFQPVFDGDSGPNPPLVFDRDPQVARAPSRP
jgi:hypothetical protein